MPDWRNWYGMALESQSAAQSLKYINARSCASRTYYCAYQAVTATLLYRGFTPPSGGEAWAHDETPVLVIDQLKSLIRLKDSRKDIARRLQTLYKLRVAADYFSERDVDQLSVITAMKDGDFILKIAESILFS